jgi:hypothetical protein
MCYDIRCYVVNTLGCLELIQEKRSRSSNKTVVAKALGMAARQNKAAVETVEKLFQSLCSTEPLRSVRNARASLGLKLLHDKQVSRVMTENATAFSVCGGPVSIGTAANGKAMLVVNVRATGPKALKRIPKKYYGFPVKVVRR